MLLESLRNNYKCNCVIKTWFWWLRLIRGSQLSIAFAAECIEKVGRLSRLNHFAIWAGGCRPMHFNTDVWNPNILLHIMGHVLPCFKAASPKFHLRNVEAIILYRLPHTPLKPAFPPDNFMIPTGLAIPSIILPNNSKTLTSILRVRS